MLSLKTDTVKRGVGFLDVTQPTSRKKMPQSNQSLESQVEELSQDLNNFLEFQKEMAEDISEKLGKICLSFFHLESLIKAEVIGLSAIVAMLIPLLIKLVSLF